MSEQKGETDRKVMLIVIDGWGVSKEEKGNSVHHAKTPVIDKFEKGEDGALYTLVDASGGAVGLPDGLMGNSEVGHLTIGGGRVNYQDLIRINKSISDGSFAKNKTLQENFEHAKSTSGRIHFLGLVSDGGVHSHIKHLFEFLKAAKDAGVPEAYVHFFADGRDTAPDSGVTYMQQVLDFTKELGYGSLATVVGRYYAMDRDKRWERVQIAYEGLVGGKGEEVSADGLIDAVKARYESKETDEFLKPFVVDKKGLIGDGDTLQFIDFRADRMREIVEVFGVEVPFADDTSVKLPANLRVAQMTQYDAHFDLPIVFPPVSMDDGLAETISKKQLRQFHTAETEKYAHVTFFFNGGTEKAFELEDRKLVASPKVATYDLQPEMSMDGVCDEVCSALDQKVYPFVLCNLAPPDMVGHTGNFDAAVTAVTACDAIIGRIYESCKKNDYVLVITADHGNAEEMLDENGNPKTSHTTRPVFVIVVGTDKTMKGVSLARTEGGGLADVAPTILHLMGIDQPDAMTGKTLVKIEK